MTLIGLMLVGGGIAGAAGGLRIVLLVVVLASIRQALGSGRERKPGAITTRAWQGLAIAASTVLCMLMLIGCVAMVLVYRETGSVLACVFEAVSVCCNVGLSTGLTEQLSTAGRIAIGIGMIAGRVLPLIILMGSLRPLSPTLPRPLIETRPARTYDDSPIPLE